MWYMMFLMIFGLWTSQTDWMGGPGVLGPVWDWGTQYYVGDSVTVATEGQACLIATDWDYGAGKKWIVESNPGIQMHAQGLMPADIDIDGILDLVAHTADSIVWYKHDGYYTFSRNVIGPADDGGADHLCVYPCDLDSDSDIDVLYATAGTDAGFGLGWYENPFLPASWGHHILDNSIGYHRVSAIDVELDGDMDVIAVDNSDTHGRGDIYLFRDTTGNQDFKKEEVKDFSTGEAWRMGSHDFNQDGYPDIYSTANSIVFLLNDGAGHFIQSCSLDIWGGMDCDGAWPSDIDMDGDIDLIIGHHDGSYPPTGFYALLNDGGTGDSFDTLLLVEDTLNCYLDGSINCDIDLDGIPDIAGTHSRVGWFRQDSLLAFTLHDVDTTGDHNSHWVYTAPINNKCFPSIDFLVTREGEHIVYENQMLLAFAGIGELESSILKIEDAAYEPCDLKYFGYNACVPNDSALSFYWRGGLDSTDIDSQPWSAPSSASVDVDSFSLALANGRMFQYKVEFKGGSDIAVLYEVWLNYECSGVGIEERPFAGTQRGAEMRAGMDGRIVLELPFEDWVRLEVYDVAGRLVKNVFSGYLLAGTHEFELSEPRGIYFARLYSSPRQRRGSYSLQNHRFCTPKSIRTLKLIKLK